MFSHLASVMTVLNSLPFNASLTAGLREGGDYVTKTANHLGYGDVYPDVIKNDVFICFSLKNSGALDVEEVQLVQRVLQKDARGSCGAS